MKYTIYYNSDKCVVMNDGQSYILNMYKKGKHIWPEDTTEISLSVSGDILSYEISNLSDRTQYLYDNDMLGLGIFVEENPRWFSRKWRSDFALTTHETRHCIKVIRIDSLSGEFDLNNLGWYEWSGCLSKQLYYPFNYGASYQDPYRPSGTENIALGVGRMHDSDENAWMVSAFRPHKVSDYYEITVYNKM